MNQYNQPDSDINEEEMTIRVRCTRCQKIQEQKIIRESLEDYTANWDGTGTYTSPYEECAECLGA